MVIVYSCLREFIVLSRITTIPPPSTVSTVLANRLGVRASKSWETENKSSKESRTSSVYSSGSQTFFRLWPDKTDQIVSLGYISQEKTHLQDTHAEGVSQDLVCLVVVAVSDVGCSDEEFKWVILVQIQRASFDLFLQMSHALLPIAISQKSNTLVSSINGK